MKNEMTTLYTCFTCDLGEWVKEGGRDVDRVKKGDVDMTSYVWLRLAILELLHRVMIMAAAASAAAAASRA